jgi:hypothetical protein
VPLGWLWQNVLFNLPSCMLLEYDPSPRWSCLLP